MTGKKRTKKRKFIPPQQELHEEPKVPKKDPKPITDYILSELGTPENLIKVEAYHYQWGEGKDDRWRVNVVVEEVINTEIGNPVTTWKRPHSFFMHFDDEMQTATYCNPPIERKY